MQFALSHLGRADLDGKSVIEVGSYNVNGSFRDHARYFGPSSYLGVDTGAGPGVDRVCRAEELVKTFGSPSFDVLISTEMLEHVRDWRVVITNFKELLKPEGLLVITTRSLGFPYHEAPEDHWRYETFDMQRIFSDFHIRVLMSDPSEPGVFLKAIRPLSTHRPT